MGSNYKRILVGEASSFFVFSKGAKPGNPPELYKGEDLNLIEVLCDKRSNFKTDR